EAAAAHVESCLPGHIATRAATCDAAAEQRSQWLSSLSCSQVLGQIADGKADGVPALKGIKVKKVGNRTYFMIPLMQTFGGDRARLLDETVGKFTDRMGQLNQEMIAHGINLGGLLTGAPAQEFA